MKWSCRRKALEAEKQARLKEMEAKRKQRENRFTAQQLEKEKERQEAVRAKENMFSLTLVLFGVHKTKWIIIHKKLGFCLFYLLMNIKVDNIQILYLEKEKKRQEAVRAKEK
jgi:hypothetical protein